MTRKLINKLSNPLNKLSKSKEYRDAFVASQINIGIPFQIRALRTQEDRNWDQKKLAEEAGMLQPRISAMEQPGYGNFNLETLKRIASAFDVALIVRFSPFSELIRWSDNFSPDNFQAPSFENEQERIAASTGENVVLGYWPLSKTTAQNISEEKVLNTASTIEAGRVTSGLQNISTGERQYG